MACNDHGIRIFTGRQIQKLTCYNRVRPAMTYEDIVTERQELIEAIATLEARRHLFGDDVVDTTLWALRKQLAAVPRADFPSQAEPQQQQLAVLVADLSGFTAASSAMDAELVGEAINELWQHLDGVIAAWGGMVDKHVGDGLIANFGLPLPRPDDADRAILAALEMQLVLGWLNRQVVSETDSNGRYPGSNGLGSIKMRIGIHIGTAFVGQVGERSRTTAVGDTITVAGALEHAAPPGGILISGHVEGLVRGRFELQAADPVTVAGQNLYVPAYLVSPDAPRSYRETGASALATAVRLVGRDDALQMLQDAFQMSSDAGLAQVVVLTGETGAGKSRLLEAFERWLAVFSQSVRLLRARQYSQLLLPPYALVRDVLLACFDVQIRYDPAVACDCLLVALQAFMREEHLPEQQVQRYSTGITHLLSYPLPHPPAAHVADASVEAALDGVIWLLEALHRRGEMPVIVLEDVHTAEDGMLNFLETLVARCQALPLLMIVTCDHQLFKRRPLWSDWLDDPFEPYMLLEMPPLSSIDSRHLVNELLQRLARVPLRLADLIVSVAAGNPFYIEQMINFLLENRVIVPHGDEWHVQLGELDQLRLPGSPPDLLRLRLAALPSLERRVLQLGAVFGRLFPDAAVRHLADVVGEAAATPEELEAALIGLEAKGLIRRSPTVTFSPAQDYLFASEAWRQVVYARTDARLRRTYHRQAAYWLIANGSARFLRQCSTAVAYQFEQAGESEQVTFWQARNGHNGDHSASEMV